MKDNTPENHESLRKTFAFTLSNTEKEQTSSQGKASEKGKKRMSVINKPPRASLFKAIASNLIIEHQKQNSMKKSSEDSLNSFPDLITMWKEISDKLTNGKTVEQVDKDLILNKGLLASLYQPICAFYKKLLIKLEEITELNGSFSNDLILIAGYGIQHTEALIIAEFVNPLANADIIINESILYEHLDSLRCFQNFYFALAKFNCNPILQEKHIFVLNETIKSTILSLQRMLQSNFKLLIESPAQTKKLQLIANFIYSSMQTIVILTIFGEQPNQTIDKYQKILDRLRTIYALISQSSIFEKIFNEPIEFEMDWNTNGNNYMLCSFNYKRLSLFLQSGKLPENENIQFSLKYMVMYFNYKILKVISQRVNLTYDEHILSMFPTLIHKNRVTLWSLISQKDKRSISRVMMLINENINIIKSYIISLAYFSDSLDPIQRQTKYDAIKEITMDCLTLAIKSGLTSDNIEDVEKISISTPKDFVALILKALLLFKKIRTKNPTSKFMSEMNKYINILAVELVSRPVPTEDSLRYNIYRLYVVQFLNEWELDVLKDKYMKYSEEMSRCLAYCEDEGLENVIVEKIKNRVQDLALDLYVKFSNIDSITPIENTIDFIRENSANELKLCKHFYIMFCLLSKHKIPFGDFQEMMKDKKELSTEAIQNSQEIDALIEKDGMAVFFMIYKISLCSYIQTKEVKYAYEQQIFEEQKRKSTDTIETETYVAQEYLRKLENTVLSYENLIDITAKFICFLHYSVKISEYFLEKHSCDNEFFEKALKLPCGRDFLLKLLRILIEKLVNNLKKADLISKFASFIVDIFVNLNENWIPYAEEKPFIFSIINLLESFICESVFINYLKKFREQCAKILKRLYFRRQY